jgi:hypothetical protein
MDLRGIKQVGSLGYYYIMRNFVIYMAHLVCYDSEM